MHVLDRLGVGRVGVVNSVLGVFGEGGEPVDSGIFVVGVVAEVQRSISDCGIGVGRFLVGSLDEGGLLAVEGLGGADFFVDGVGLVEGEVADRPEEDFVHGAGMGNGESGNIQKN